MKALIRHSGVAAALLMVNVDTDQIIPARFLHRSRAQGFGDVLFSDLRSREDGSVDEGFVLNHPPFDKATILISLDNFGCGSSREHAVWALMDFGIRVVIAPSFGDIFAGNAFKNGLLPIALPLAAVEKLMAFTAETPGACIEVDLPDQRILAGRLEVGFVLNRYHKNALLQGLSETRATLNETSAIEAFEEDHARKLPWLGSEPVDSAESP